MQAERIPKHHLSSRLICSCALRPIARSRPFLLPLPSLLTSYPFLPRDAGIGFVVATRAKATDTLVFYCPKINFPRSCMRDEEVREDFFVHDLWMTSQETE